MKRLQAVGIACLLCVSVLPVEVQAQLTYTTNNDGTLNVSGYSGPGGAVIIPGTNNDLLVTSIGDSAFLGFGLTSVTIPNTVTSIGDGAFFFCSSLTAVYFQGNPPSLGSQVFGSPAFPSGLTYPDCYYLPGTTGWGSMFGNCPAFMWSPPYICTPSNGAITIDGYTGAGGGALVIPDVIDGLPVSSIGTNAFAGSSLTNVTIPSSITSIEGDAFSGCALVSISFPSSVTNIGDDAFQGCGNLTNIIFPNSGAIRIGNWSFIGCTSLTSIMIPNGVTSIGYYTFGQCTALTNVMISNGLTSIGQFAFLGCINLVGVYFTGDAPGADWTVFMNDSQTTVYYLPGTMGWGLMFGGSPTAQWWLPNPLILDNSSSFGVRSNRFGFTISWATNTSVVVEASTNLATPNWCALATNTLISGWSDFNDQQWTNYPARFYRLRLP